MVDHQVRKDWKVWIENRVQVIGKNVAPDCWMYVLTDSNPVDITTRLLSPNAFVNCEMWWKGPDFLHFENIDMPCQSFLRPEVSEGQKVETVLFTGSEKLFGIEEVVDNSRFRSLQKLLRATSYVRRFVKKLKVILEKEEKVSEIILKSETLF